MTAPDRMALLSTFATPCPDCRQPIMWAWTAASGGTERMPIDAVPVAHGNIRVRQEGRRLVCDVIGSVADRRRLTLGGWPLYVHHRLSCPNAARWATPTRRPEPRRTVEAPDPAGLW